MNYVIFFLLIQFAEQPGSRPVLGSFHLLQAQINCVVDPKEKTVKNIIQVNLVILLLNLTTFFLIPSIKL